MRTGLTNETDAKKRRRARSGHSKSVSKSLRQSVQGFHQEGARDGMGERLRLGLKQRNIRETNVGPRKGKNTGESPELSKTCGLREDNQ